MSSIGIATCLDPDLEAEIIREIPARDLPLKVVRRCRDLTEILATAQAKLVELVVLDTEMIELDGEARTQLGRAGATVVAFAPFDDLEYLRHLGGISVLTKPDPRLDEFEDSDATRILNQVMTLLMPPPPPDPRQIQVSTSTGNSELDVSETGKVIAFWGAAGSPGKSTLLVNVAASLRAYGRVLMVDADTVEPALSQMLGIPLETSGLVAACRLAEQGRLNAASFETTLTSVGLEVDLLTGMTKADRWREVGEKPLATLLDWARETYRWILVDLASGADDPEDFFATMGPSRFGAQRGAFSETDLLVEVGLADPVGLRRLIVNHERAAARGLWTCPQLVVVNRGRESVGGSQWSRSLRQILSQELPEVKVALVREAREEIDRALVAGCDVATSNPEAAVLEDFTSVQNEILRVFGMVPSRSVSRGRKLPKGEGQAMIWRSWKEHFSADSPALQAQPAD